jgi:hypothetical protein
MTCPSIKKASLIWISDFEARDDKTYSVEIAANRAGINGGVELATKTITVTVTDLDDEAPTDIQINDESHQLL